MAWTGRLIAESLSHEHSRVLTLTYAEDKDRFSELNYGHIQDFLKTHRHYASERTRYFVCGEYGEESGHAHWHIVLFGEQSWQPIGYKKAVFCAVRGWTDRHGFASCMRLVPASAAYTVGYTLKKGENQSPFMRCSLKPSIAFGKIDAFAAQVFKSNGSRPIQCPSWWIFDGKKYPFNDGAARRFQKSYEALGGQLLVKRPEVTNMEALMYLRSDEYLSEKTFKRLARDEKDRKNGPTPQEIADRQHIGSRPRI